MSAFKHKFNPEQVEARLQQLREAIRKETDPFRMQEHVAELQVTLSERAEIATQRVERLTAVLTVLTIALLLLTAYLTYDIFLKHQSDKRDTPNRQTAV